MVIWRVKLKRSLVFEIYFYEAILNDNRGINGGDEMSVGELACETLKRMSELMNDKEKITGFEICQELTGKIDDQEFISLVKELIALSIVERYDFVGRNDIGRYIQLSEKGKKMTDRIKDDDLRKYFIVAITIYCNQKKLTSNELYKLLSKITSFKSEDDVREIIKNFRKTFVIEEKFTKVGENWKRAIKIKDCAFDIIAMEEPKQNITSV